jgi:hypothetical protein
MLVVGATGKSQCSYCGGDLGPNALYCPKCLVPVAQLAPKRRPSTLSLLLGVSLVFGGPSAWVIGGQYRSQLLNASPAQTVVHAAAPQPPVDQAEALIRGCGAPDRDVSTANNDPRPPIPFRVLDYGSQHLQFAFIPGGGAKIGDPPPYIWALSGILDSTTNQRISLQEAAGRMSCVAPLEAMANPSPAVASSSSLGPSDSAGGPPADSSDTQ